MNSYSPFTSPRNSKPSLSRGSSLVSVSSIQDLSKVAAGILTDETPKPTDGSFDGENSSHFEEVPGAWSGGVEEDNDESPITTLAEKTQRHLVIGFVFTILTLLGSLFFAASLLNGGLPRYSVEQAELITVYYDQNNVIAGDIKRNGNWKYYRFQTHNEVENITVHIKAIQELNETYLPPLAVYLQSDMVPRDALDINGTSILQGASTPSNRELDGMLKDHLNVCGPRTVYIGITLPYWTPATASLEDVHYELSVYREVPTSWDGLCETERLRAAILVYILQPVAVGFCLISCVGFYALGMYNRFKLKQLRLQTVEYSALVGQELTTF